jgi:hypothetical protein
MCKAVTGAGLVVVPPSQTTYAYGGDGWIPVPPLILYPVSLSSIYIDSYPKSVSETCAFKIYIFKNQPPLLKDSFN